MHFLHLECVPFLSHFSLVPLTSGTFSWQRFTYKIFWNCKAPVTSPASISIKCARRLWVIPFSPPWAAFVTNYRCILGETWLGVGLTDYARAKWLWWAGSASWSFPISTMHSSEQGTACNGVTTARTPTYSLTPFPWRNTLLLLPPSYTSQNAWCISLVAAFHIQHYAEWLLQSMDKGIHPKQKCSRDI